MKKMSLKTTTLVKHIETNSPILNVNFYSNVGKAWNIKEQDLLDAFRSIEKKPDIIL